jgi:hypothetical protein
VNLEEDALQEAKLGSEFANLDFDEERSDGKADIAELINVLQAILCHTQRKTIVFFFYEYNALLAIILLCECEMK